MENRVVFKIGLIFLMFLGLAITAHPVEKRKDASEFLYFKWGGGHSPFSSKEVKILTDGKTIVQIKIRPEKRTIEKIFQLDQKELEYFKLLIKNADFFNLPEVKMQRIIDAGITTLRVSLDGKMREITFQRRAELDEITSSLWKLANQGLIVGNLERGKGISDPCGYEALASLSPHKGGMKVFQPGVLIEPLENFISSLNIEKEEASQENLLYTIEALAWITRPEEWGGFLSSYAGRLDNLTRYKFFELITTWTISNRSYSRYYFPKTHLGSLHMLQTNFLNSEYRNWTKLPKEKLDVLSNIISDLRLSYYAPAIPVLINMVEELTSKDLEEAAVKVGSYYREYPSYALSWMGKAAVIPTSRLLYSNNPRIRIDAIRIFMDMLHKSPKDEQRDFLSSLKFSVIPKVQEMVNQDTDSNIRREAEDLLRLFKYQWTIEK